MIVLTSAELDDLAEANPSMTLGELAQLGRLPTTNTETVDRLCLYADNTYGVHVRLSAVAKRHGARLVKGTYSRGACERAYSAALYAVKSYHPAEAKEFNARIRAYAAHEYARDLEQDFREGYGVFDV